MNQAIPYLISKEFYWEAKDEAIRLGISPSQWRYIPWDPEDERRHILAGLVGYTEEKLIGWFRDEERFMLMRP